MARYSQDQRDAGDGERFDAETRLYEPVRQPAPVEPPLAATPAPAYPVNVNVAPAAAGPPGQDRALAAARLNAVLMWLFGLIEALIAIRVILKALAADQAAAFTAFIYAVTGPLVGPFIGVLPSPQFGGAVFEFPALLAILIYVLASLLLTRLIRILFIDQPQLR